MYRFGNAGALLFFTLQDVFLSDGNPFGDFQSPKKNLARLMPGEEISQLNFFIYVQEQGRQAAGGG